MDLYGKIRAAAARGAEVRAARRAAVRQRQHPHRHGAQQDPEGIRRQIAIDGRLRRARTWSGYDCHGLPIELQVDRELGPKKREMSVADFCRACRAYAERFIGTMTEQFQRLGILGTWDDPYLTMNFKYQAAIARAFGPVRRAGARLQGQEAGPLVHPLPHGARRSRGRVRGSRRRRRSTSSFRSPRERGELAARVPALAGREVSVLIWTTTPWTIPSNLAIAFHPEFDYAAYDVDGRAVIVAEALAPAVASRSSAGRSTSRSRG